MGKDELKNRYARIEDNIDRWKNFTPQKQTKNQDNLNSI